MLEARNTTENNYDISKNYELLYEFVVNQNKTLICFVDYGDNDRDIAKIFIPDETNSIIVCCRGVQYNGYLTISDGKDKFIKSCEKMNLSFVM